MDKTFKLLKFLINVLQENRGVKDKVEICRLNMLIGYGGIVLCSTVPRIGIWFVDPKSNLFLYSTIMLFITCRLLFSCFIVDCNRIVKNMNEKFIVRNILINLTALIITLVFAKDFRVKSPAYDSIFMGSQMICFLIGTSSAMDFSGAWTRSMKLRTSRERQLFDREKTKKELMAQINKPTIRDDQDVHSYLDATMISYMFLMGLLSFLAIPSLFFGGCILVLFAVVIIGAVVFGALEQVKLHLDRSGKLKLKVLIGFGGISISGIIPRLVVFCAPRNYDVLTFTGLISLISAISFHYLLAQGYKKSWKFDYNKGFDIQFYLILGQLILTMVMIRIGVAYESSNEIEMIIFHQIGFFFMTLFASVDFVMVLAGGLISINEGIEAAEEDNDMMFPRLGCKNCNLLFSDKVIPRILTNCGHTMCEACIDNQLNMIRCGFLSCPTCLACTDVDGSASSLPKNYNVLDIIQEIQRMEV